ncbi:hypothetical protein HYDPIDRAFT_110458 [Hydnomerulius pinastri MD-312]|nr:hypothetical protein HYDPIDRAFT_110458 [Hydnomerulius pinastri MD-312]
MPTYPYVVINAFTRDPLGGNPAVIVLLPPGSLSPNPPSPSQVLDTPTMIALGKSFAQPIIVFISPPSPGATDRAFDIRFFSNDYAPLICGHGIGVGEDLVVRFRTAAGRIVNARAVPPPLSSVMGVEEEVEEGGEFYEIELPTNGIEEITGQDRDRVRDSVAKALRKETSDAGINLIARGSGKMGDYLMVVLDESEELEGRDVDIPALLDASQIAGGPFSANIFTHLTSDRETAFVSRVFDPVNGILEDHVCGSAHTLLVPYYASLDQSGVKAGEEVHVRQVGPRGGDLWVTLDEENGVVRLKGNSRLFAKGEFTL